MTTALGSAAHSYEILTKLAEGGMAEIFLARVTGARAGLRHVVLKRVSRERAMDTQYVRMFLDEAALAAQLSHPNVAQVFDVGRLGTSYFFTMEYVHGVTVQALIDRAREKQTAIPIGAALAIIAGAAAGLGHAHSRNGPDGRPLHIIHRDVSPSNLMVSFEGQVKVVDFGVAKAAFTPETQAGEIKGKVSYLSPEQCRSLKLDRRSDLFSLGIVAWEMLTSRRLFKRATAFETMVAIATEDAPPPSSVRPDLPPAIDELVMRLLAVEPHDRVQSSEELLAAVERAGQQTIAAMTPSVLARLLRDLFGVVPEPWLVLAGEGLTVMSTPIPEALDTQDDPGSVDQKLATQQFSSVSVVTPRPLLDDADEPSLTTNLIVAGAPVNERATRKVPVLANEAAKLLDDHLPDHLPDHLLDHLPDPTTERDPQRAPVQPSDPMGETLDWRGPRAAEARASVAAMVAGPRERPPTRPPPEPRPRTASAAPPLASSPNADTIIGPQGRPPSAVPATAAHSIGGANPVTLMGSGAYGVRGSRPQANVASPGSGPQIAIPGSGPRAQVVAAAPSPRSVAPPPTTVSLRWWIIGGSLLGMLLTTIIVVATRGDAPAVGPPADAAITRSADAPAPDAAIAAIADAPEPETVDAAEPEPEAAAPDAAPDEPTPPAIAPRPRGLRTRAELEAASRDGRFKDVIAACAPGGATGELAVVCTLAACRTGNKVAQTWFRNVSPKQRDSVIRECKRRGLTIRDVCAEDLTACRQ